MNARVVGGIEFDLTQALRWLGVRLLVYFLAALLGAATFFTVGYFYTQLNPLPEQIPQEMPKKKDDSNKPNELIPFESKDVKKIIDVPVAKLPAKQREDIFAMEPYKSYSELQLTPIVLLNPVHSGRYFLDDYSFVFSGVPIYDSNNQRLGEIERMLTHDWVVVDVKKLQYGWLPDLFVRSTGWGVDYRFAVKASDITWTWEDARGKFFTSRYAFAYGGYVPRDLYLDSVEARISWWSLKPVKGVAPISKGQIEQ